jgi:peptidyl-prolyl cis-trans isomerase B (cyclophilin B)
MQAIIKIRAFGEIIVELDHEQAPITVENFVKLAKSGFYRNLTFHRVIKSFMIQGGCPKGNGTGGPGYTIKGEFKRNGVNNTISHVRGVISMARAMDPNSAGSQFFIMHKDGTYLDGQYAAFGRVISGIEVVDAIAKVRTTPNDRPYETVQIEDIIIED